MKTWVTLAISCTVGSVFGQQAQVGVMAPLPTNDVGILVAKYLPNYGIREVPAKEGRGRYLELVAPDGTPVPDVPHWQGLKPLTAAEVPQYAYLGNPQLNAILRDRKTTVASSGDALEVGRLVWCLGRPRYSVAKTWSRNAERIEGGWLLKALPYKVPMPAGVEHVGDFEIVVDADQRFVAFREREDILRPANHTSDGIRQPADGSPKPSR
jgi:hypothetical protein